jgi:hypothetical protein
VAGALVVVILILLLPIKWPGTDLIAILVRVITGAALLLP